MENLQVLGSLVKRLFTLFEIHNIKQAMSYSKLLAHCKRGLLLLFLFLNIKLSRWIYLNRFEVGSWSQIYRWHYAACQWFNCRWSGGLCKDARHGSTKAKYDVFWKFSCSYKYEYYVFPTFLTSFFSGLQFTQVHIHFTILNVRA